MNSKEKLYRDIISFITTTRGRKSTSDFVGRINYEGSELNFNEINSVLAEMNEKDYLNVLNTHGPEKIVLAVQDKGYYFMKFGQEESSQPSSYTTNFYGPVDRSNVATGNNNNQKQNNKTSNDIDEMVTFLTPFLEKILQDANAPEAAKEQTNAIMEDLGELKVGNILLDTFKLKVKEYVFGLLPSIASHTPSISEAVQGISTFING